MKGEPDVIRVSILYWAAPNERAGQGWLPAVSVNGRRIYSGWAYRGYSKDGALAVAKAEADAEATQYRGDWTVTVEELRE